MGGTRDSSKRRDGRDRLAVAFDADDGRRVSWDEFFERFDRESLAFAYEPDGNGEGVRSRASSSAASRHSRR